MSSKAIHHQQRKVTSKMAAMLTLVVISLLFIGSGFYGPHWAFDYSTLSYEVRDTILKIERVAERDLNQVTSGEIIDAQRYRQDWVRHNATHAELQALLDYPNAGIKLIAYKALLDCHNIDHYALLERAVLQDTTEAIYIPSHQGAIKSQRQYTTVGAYLLDYIVSERPFGLELSQGQIHQLVALSQGTIER